MAFKFNPFTGTLDQTGSGGGGSSYIDGEAAAYSDLPLQSNAIVSGLSATQFNGTYLYDGQVNGRPSYALNPNTRLSWDSQWQLEADGDVATSSSDVANPWLATGWVMDSLDPTGLVITESNPAPLNTAWLVREASGAWLLARKPAGIYIRTATLGVSRDADYTYAGILPDVFNDANFLLYDNGDPTKNLQFQLSGITTGQTRTLTVPNSSGTISLTGHTHIASDIVFGQFANNRINWASPDAIGSSVPSTGDFTTLTAATSLVVKDGSDTGTFVAASKLTANRTYDLPDASGTIALLETLPAGGTSNLWIPASAWIPKTTAGCGVDSRETTTNDQNFDELLFESATGNEFADALVIMPSNYNNGTVTARFYWTAASGSGGVAWGIQGRAFANDDALDTAAGTAQLVTDTLIAANDMHITSATSAVTIGGTPAANTPIQFTIYRSISDAADTLGVDARLLGVQIIYTAA